MAAGLLILLTVVALAFTRGIATVQPGSAPKPNTPPTKGTQRQPRRRQAFANQK